MNKIVLLCLVVALVGCSEDSWLDYKIPESSSDMYQGYPFSKDSRQTSFVIDAKYPSEMVLNNIGNLLDHSWELCPYGGESWQDFEDVTGDEPKHVFQRIQTWRSQNAKQLVFVSLRYESESCNSSECLPTDDLQSVAIIEHNLPWYLFWRSFDELCNV